MRWQAGSETCALDQETAGPHAARWHGAAATDGRGYGIGLNDDDAGMTAVSLAESEPPADLLSAAVESHAPTCSSGTNSSGGTGALRYCAQTRGIVGR